MKICSAVLKSLQTDMTHRQTWRS